MTNKADKPKRLSDYTPKELENLNKRVAEEKTAAATLEKKQTKEILIMSVVVAIIVFGGAWAFFTSKPENHKYDGSVECFPVEASTGSAGTQYGEKCYER